MRDKSSWKTENPEKVLRIVTAVVGKKVLDGWRQTRIGSYGTACELLYPVVYAKVKKFSVRKLGEICGFATHRGYHFCKEEGKPPPFINHTGYADFYEPGTGPGRLFERDYFPDIMQEVAILTIIALAIDFAWQDTYLRDWGKKGDERPPLKFTR